MAFYSEFSHKQIVIFHSYVSLAEGNWLTFPFLLVNAACCTICPYNPQDSRRTYTCGVLCAWAAFGFLHGGHWCVLSSSWAMATSPRTMGEITGITITIYLVIYRNFPLVIYGTYGDLLENIGNMVIYGCLPSGKLTVCY